MSKEKEEVKFYCYINGSKCWSLSFGFKSINFRIGGPHYIDPDGYKSWRPLVRHRHTEAL